MAWTRRQFLSRTTILGATVTVGCSTRVGGSPRPDPAAEPAPASSAPPVDTITIGVLNYEPFAREDGGEIAGMVPDVAHAVFEAIGVSQIKFVLQQEEQQVLASLAAGAIDLAGGLAVRKELCDGVEFSIPDFVWGTVLIVPAGNPKGLNTYDDVKAKGAKLGVVTNFPHKADATATGVPAGKIVDLPDPVQLTNAVGAGQVDCGAYFDLGAQGLIESANAELTTTDSFSPPKATPIVSAYAFNKDNTELLDSFNNRLRDLHESGDWLAMVSQYGLTEDNLPPAEMTAEQACGR
jgi:polar amino acid transport system substrate-binding protein